AVGLPVVVRVVEVGRIAAVARRPAVDGAEPAAPALGPFGHALKPRLLGKSEEAGAVVDLSPAVVAHGVELHVAGHRVELVGRSEILQHVVRDEVGAGSDALEAYSVVVAGRDEAGDAGPVLSELQRRSAEVVEREPGRDVLMK